jgi:hypothetical protein
VREAGTVAGGVREAGTVAGGVREAGTVGGGKSEKRRDGLSSRASSTKTAKIRNRAPQRSAAVHPPPRAGRLRRRDDPESSPTSWCARNDGNR